MLRLSEDHLLTRVWGMIVLNEVNEQHYDIDLMPMLWSAKLTAVTMASSADHL